MTPPTRPTKKAAIETPPRIKRELSTIKAMVKIYCRAHHHSTTTPCSACHKLEQYAVKRLVNCIFQENKPTCGSCPIHCYKPSMRNEIVKVMRYSGPRMILHHPYLAFLHLIDGRRTAKHLAQAACNKPLNEGESEP